MNDTEFFPVSISCIGGYYYPFGNTPPEDLLQSITTDILIPDVLLLGCGDLRSCLYTLWSNFDHRHARKFKGVHFVLNDINAAALARNIIFLYLCTKIPASHEDKVKWVASFWAIWYCHELLPYHKEVLMDALSNLLRWSSSMKSWIENDNNPLRLIVKFTSAKNLSRIHQIWKRWYSARLTVTEIKAKRSKRCQSFGTDFMHDPSHQLFSYFGGILLKNFSKQKCKVLKDDVKSYHQNGFVFAEAVLGLPYGTPTMANCTFIDRSDGLYNISRDFTPFRNFFFAYQLSPKNLERLHHYSDIPLMVEDNMFTHKPLLANGVQQFSIWVRSCAKILCQSLYDILFTFQCTDAFNFCQCLYNNPLPVPPICFDVIYSSNLLDNYAPPSLVLLPMQILKPDGVLFTSIIYHTSISNTLAEYVEKCFGVKCKHLQLLCGVRCVGYEDEYSNIFSIEPVPHSYGLDTVIGVRVKSLIWQHVTATPLTKPKEDHLAFLWKTLSSAISRLLTFDDGVWNYFGSTGSVTILLQAFASQFNKATHDCSTFHFWKPLCSLLLKERGLQKFMNSLQTQALLHDVHLHLTLSEKDCPLCKKQKITEAIVQQCITVSADKVNTIGSFTVIVGDKSLHKRVNQLQLLFHNSIDGLHTIDDVAISVDDDKVHAHFFIPVSFSQRKYKMSLMFNNVPLEGHKNEMAHKNYFFNKSIQKLPCQQSPSVLGTVIQHSGDDHHFETVIILNDPAMLSHQLTTQQCNGRTIRIAIGDYYTDISYPYTIEYGKRLSVKLSRKNKEVIITAYRTRCSLHEEPVFMVNSDNILSLPIMLLNEVDAKSFSGLSLWCDPRLPVPDTAEYHLKETIAILLQSTTENFFVLYCDIDGNPEAKFLMAVLNRVFDCRNKTPAIDVLYWHCSDQDHPFVMRCDNRLKFTNTTTYHMAIKVFDYFTRCTTSTRPAPKDNTTYQYLVEQKVEHLFTNRAVIYPLYPNGDGKIADNTTCDTIRSFLISNTEAPASHQMPYWFKKFKAILHEDKCCNCHRHSSKLLTCSRCFLVQYCDRNCQTQHWGTHKVYCKSSSK